jgi:ribosomal protein S14
MRTGSPGNHPHSDRRNWRPATTLDEYLRNCREGLEEHSDRRLAKFMGWSRIHLYRVRAMASLPDELFECLLAAGVLSSAEMARVANALRRNAPFSRDTERCPHCGEVIRVRVHLSKKARAAIRAWLGPDRGER